MKTIEELEELHEKALNLLDLAKEADKRIAVQNGNIKMFKKHFLLCSTLEACHKKIESLKGAKKRILVSYTRILTEIFEYNR